MRIVLLTFFVLLIVLKGALQLIAQEPPKVSDAASNVPISYGIVADNSGSMRPYLDALTLTTKVIVQHNKSKDQTFLVRFVNRNNIVRLQDLTEDSEKIAKAAEDFFSEGGQTAIMDALYQSAEYLANSVKKGGQDRRFALIVISDGEDRESKHKYEELLKLVIGNKITIYSIGYSKLVRKDAGKKAFETATGFLQKLSSDTGGKSFFPATVGELNGSVDEIFASIRK